MTLSQKLAELRKVCEAAGARYCKMCGIKEESLSLTQVLRLIRALEIAEEALEQTQPCDGCPYRTISEETKLSWLKDESEDGHFCHRYEHQRCTGEIKFRARAAIAKEIING